MQTKKAKYHLKRIQTILSLHEDSLSRLDRDILLEDIRQLYDLVLNHEDTQEIKVPEADRDHTYVAPRPVVKEKAIQEEETEEPTITPQNDEVQTSSSEPEQMLEQEQIPEPEELPEPEQQEEVNEPSHPISDPIESTDTPATVTYEKKSEEHDHGNNGPSEYMQHGSVEKMNGSSEVHTSNQPEQEKYEEVMVQETKGYPELFDFLSTSDLSDRLANTKIEHLNKILTINDKILFINHLFHGEAIPFQESLKKFESFYTYEEAKKYASEELVESYTWTEGEKKATVQQFMRQVKRLY